MWFGITTYGTLLPGYNGLQNDVYGKRHFLNKSAVASFGNARVQVDLLPIEIKKEMLIISSISFLLSNPPLPGHRPVCLRNDLRNILRIR
jgi:hypothetical protein